MSHHPTGHFIRNKTTSPSVAPCNRNVLPTPHLPLFRPRVREGWGGANSQLARVCFVSPSAPRAVGSRLGSREDTKYTAESWSAGVLKYCCAMCRVV